MASKEILESLAQAVTKKPPFCTGTLPITDEESTLFYKQPQLTANWFNLSQPTQSQLESLAKACKPATFGRNKDDVLDETYRKAGKLDSEDFSSKINVEKLGILDRIKVQLLESGENWKSVRAELYKLNVYGKGAFFKSHKDTPRDNDMFGYLVIVFPIPHEGGSLVLRHSDQEWTFDSAALTKKQTTPSIEYIAFYSDVDHEVTVVESGYRVTLTYNLYFGTEARSNLSAVSPVAPDERIFRETLAATLDNPSFLPSGGYLGFGMSFKYPFSGKSSARARVELGTKLKGSDALIYRVCGETSLETSLKANYEADDGLEVLVPLNNLLGDNLVENGVAMALCEDHDGLVVHEFGTPLPTFGYSRRPIPDEQVAHLAWVTPQTSYNNFASTYAAYGNEPTSETAYADLCIVVKVGPYGKRATASGLPGKSLRDTLKERLDNLRERFESFQQNQGITILVENDNAPIASAAGPSSPPTSV